MRRVVVTGMGAVTPVGIGIENFWNSIKEKKTGFDKITKFDTTGFKASLAAEIKDFDPKEFMDFKAAGRGKIQRNAGRTAGKTAGKTADVAAWCAGRYTGTLCRSRDRHEGRRRDPTWKSRRKSPDLYRTEKCQP